MKADSNPSVSEWINGAKDGDSAAVRALWQRYFARLVRLARKKLAGESRRAADEEDVALSAFATFCKAAKQGRFPQLTDRDDLWRLLIKLTAQKVIDQKRYERRAKRRPLADDAPTDDEAPLALEEIIGDSPTPEFAAIMAEECAQLLGGLNPDLRAVALAKLEDYTNREIAAKLVCSVSTVERGLRLIRRIWRQKPEPGAAGSSPTDLRRSGS